MNNKFKTKSNIYPIIGTSLIVLAIILIIWFFLKGERTVTGTWTEDEKKESLVCSATNKKYPFFEYDNPLSSDTRVNIVFGAENIDSISLSYTQYFGSSKETTDSLNINNNAMSMELGKDGLTTRDYGLKFSKFSDGIQMSIFLNKGNFDNRSAKYFLLDDTNNMSSSSIKMAYGKQGFNCTNQ